MRHALSTIAAGSLLIVIPRTTHSQALPPDNEPSLQRLQDSPRHGEWIRFGG